MASASHLWPEPLPSLLTTHIVGGKEPDCSNIEPEERLRLEQEWLTERFEGMRVEDFCQDFEPDALRIYLTADLTMPDEFANNSLSCAGGRFGITPDETERLKRTEAVLALCNYTDPIQLAILDAISRQVDLLGHEAPPIFLLFHSHLRSKRADEDVYASTVRNALTQGIDGVVSEEYAGFTLALESRLMMRKSHSMTNTLSNIVTRAHSEARQLESYQVCIEGIIWEYLRLRHAPNTIPPCDESLLGEDREIRLKAGLQFGQKLGEGMSGIVHQVLTYNGKCSGQVVKLQPKSCTKSIADFKVLKRTVDIFQKLSSGAMAHPNVAMLHEVLHSPTHIMLIMEDAGPENFYHRLVRSRVGPGSKPMPPEQVKDITTQAFLVVHHLHVACSMAHRDIKPENFIVSDRGDKTILKLVDFDMTLIVKPGSLCTSPCGTIPFVAPEVMLEKAYDGLKSDIWSLGIVMTEVLVNVRNLEDHLNLHALVVNDNELRHQCIVRAVKEFFQPNGAVSKYICERCRCELRSMLRVFAPLLYGMLACPANRCDATWCYEKMKEL